MSNPFDIQLTPDEDNRRRFLVGLKRKVNLELPAKLRSLAAQHHFPVLERKLGRPLEQTSREDRSRLAELIHDETDYKTWAALTYQSQDQMWEFVADVLERELPRLQALADSNPGKAGGSLELDSELELPRYIAGHEIHRQPGGFTYDAGDGDTTAGAFYRGANLIYGPGKNVHNQPGYGAAEFIGEQVQRLFGDIEPKRILDVGCGAGVNTTALAGVFPEAEIVGVDCAPGFLRFAHAFAEYSGRRVHFRQMNIEDLGAFADGSFDLVVSTIVGHETTQKALPKVMAECWRVLAPGGAVLHMDVPTQITRLGLVDQILNDWQVKNNGEHFWTGWAEANVRSMMESVGYPQGSIVAEHFSRVPNAAPWFLHGASKPH